MILLLLALAQAPANLAGMRVGPSGASALCELATDGGQIAAGQSAEAVLFVDGTRYDWNVPHPIVNHYQEVGLWIYPPCWSVGPFPCAAQRLISQADDTAPLCPSGSVNAGQRPHVFTLPALTPGAYRLEGMVIDRTGLSDPALAAYIGFTPTLAVTVK